MIESSVYTSSKIRVCAAIITHDDEHRIEGTIKSVLSQVDRVYLMDTGSTDRTVEIARELGAIVFEMPWKNDDSLVRNTLLEHIESEGKADSVLWINAGEMFDYRTAAAFRNFVESEMEPDTAYVLVARKYAINANHQLSQLLVHFIRNGSSDEYTGLYPVDGFSDWNEETIEMRLLPVSERVRFSGRIRESVIGSLELAGIPISAAPGRILDVLRIPTHPERVAESQKVMKTVKSVEQSGLALSDEELLAKANAMVSLSDVIGARELYTKLIENSTQNGVRLEAFYRYDETFQLVPPRGMEKVEFLLKGLDSFPLDTQLLVLLGFAVFEQKNFEMAIRVFRIAVEHGQISFDIWHRQCIREIAIAHLSLLYRITGEQDEAVALLEKSIEQCATHAQLVKLLIDLYTAKRDEEKLHALAARFWGDCELDWIREVFTGACRATAGAWSAALISLENAYVCGCRDLICLRWYSLALLSNLRFEEACVVLDEWLKLEPHNFEAKSFRFAAARPDRFQEILEHIQKAQANKLGIDADSNFDGLILEEIRELTAEEKEDAAFVFNPEPAHLGFDVFRFESPDLGGSSSELNFRPSN